MFTIIMICVGTIATLIGLAMLTIIFLAMKAPYAPGQDWERLGWDKKLNAEKIA
jgi:hypothetical protein